MVGKKTPALETKTVSEARRTFSEMLNCVYRGEARVLIDRIDRALAIELMDEQIEPFAPDPTVTGVADDEGDDLVLGTAVAAGADYRVTGDTGLLEVGEHGGAKIVTARAFLILIEGE